MFYYFDLNERTWNHAPRHDSVDLRGLADEGLKLFCSVEPHHSDYNFSLEFKQYKYKYMSLSMNANREKIFMSTRMKTQNGTLVGVWVLKVCLLGGLPSMSPSIKKIYAWGLRHQYECKYLG